MLAFAVSALGFATFPTPPSPPAPVNPCEGAKPKDAQFTDADGVLDPSRTIYNYFDNRACAEMIDTGFNIALPQAGMDVTKDGVYGDLAYNGTFDPIMTDYSDTDLCPVNVHWHMGTEHRSQGQYDEDGKGPHPYADHGKDMRRRLGEGQVRQGMLCHHYDDKDAKFTTPYDFKYCKQMEVGQTYEVHWPHSAAGACGTEWQYQYPFYDGVFCMPGVISLGDNPPFNVPAKVGVEGQIFTIVNSAEPQYQNDNLFAGAWKDNAHWTDVAKYVGSTTGTSRDNEVCSMYSPITWQVDRTCHMVSAASFDKLCEAMYMNKVKGDDMDYELMPHGSRELVLDEWSSASVMRKQ